MRVFLLEFLDASRGIDDLLLARVERMAFRTDFDIQVLGHGRARFERAAATADNAYLFVFRMNFFFHRNAPCVAC